MPLTETYATSTFLPTGSVSDMRASSQAAVSSREVRDRCRKVLEYLIATRRCAQPETANAAIAAVDECTKAGGRYRVVDVERELLFQPGTREKGERLARALNVAVERVELFREEAIRNNDRRFKKVNGGLLGKAVHEWLRWSRKFVRLEALSRLGREVALSD